MSLASGNFIKRTVGVSWKEMWGDSFAKLELRDRFVDGAQLTKLPRRKTTRFHALWERERIESKIDNQCAR